MKKKKTLYVMIPIVVVVWAFVFYQLFGSFFSTPNYAKEKEVQIISIDEVIKDTFFIVADYRDPFLGNKVRLKKRGSSSSKAKRTARKKTSVKAEKPWPTIFYKGMIKNNNSNRKVCIVQVDGKEYMVKEKDIIREITILAINKNTVKVRFQKESKTLTK